MCCCWCYYNNCWIDINKIKITKPMSHMEKRSIDKSTGLSDSEVNMLREQFVHNYSKDKGWDRANLTTEQLIEIKDQKGYKTPGMILG